MFAGGSRICIAVLSVSLAFYGLDCAGMTTPQQAMQCCQSMQCMSHQQHHTDCCKTMPSASVDVGQPTPFALSLTPVACVVAVASNDAASVTSAVRVVEHQSHAPPLLLFGSILPLRI